MYIIQTMDVMCNMQNIVLHVTIDEHMSQMNASANYTPPLEMGSFLQFIFLVATSFLTHFGRALKVDLQF